MEKFSLHESLRIYLPGLLLTGLIYFIVNLTLQDIQLILLPALFVGILLNSIIWNFHAKTFKTLNETYILKVFQQEITFDEAWKKIIQEKMEKLNKTELKDILYSEDGNNVQGFVERSFFSKRYELIELNYFRSPKSFGIMCYNLAFVCKISVVFSICFGIYECSKTISNFTHFIPYLAISLALILSYFFFLRSSKQYFIHSLNREIHYWESINIEEISEVIDLIELWRSLSLMRK